MKKLRCFTVCIILLSALILTACGWVPADYTGNFEYRLQGTWETYDLNESYYGLLKITSNKISIDGYNQWYDDPRRPFNDFPKYFTLDGHSEKTNNNRGIIYIENVDGVLHEIPYIYSSEYDSLFEVWVEKLLFTFPSLDAEYKRFETLIKLAD